MIASQAVNIEAPPTIKRQRLLSLLMWLGIAALMVWAFFGTEISLGKLLQGVGESWKLLFGTATKPNSGFIPPNFSRFPEYLEQILLTIKMAMWGTALAVLPAIGLSILGAKNTSPHPVVYFVTRRILDLLRAVPEFVLALVFVVAVGLGPFSGILALAVYTTGILAKLFSEGIETVDPGQVEAVRAAGGNAFQAFTHGVFPQVLPHIASMTLYRFESNVRAAQVLGLVGAGGIGFFLNEALRGFDFPAAGAIITLIIISVFFVDFLSSKIRERLT